MKVWERKISAFAYSSAYLSAKADSGHYSEGLLLLSGCYFPAVISHVLFTAQMIGWKQPGSRTDNPHWDKHELLSGIIDLCGHDISPSL